MLPKFFEPFSGATGGQIFLQIFVQLFHRHPWSYAHIPGQNLCEIFYAQ
jgi:hypothetical protein